MNRDAIKAELLEIEAQLQDERLKDEDQHACTARSRPAERARPGHMAACIVDNLSDRQSSD